MRILIVVTLVLLLGRGCARWDSARQPLDVGDKAPAGSLPGERTGLIWAFNAAGCLPCNFSDAARELRRLQRLHAGRLDLSVVAISDNAESDRDLVEGFLSRQRIPATVIMAKSATYGAEFGRSVPVLFAVRQGIVVGVLDPYPGELPGLLDWPVVEGLIGGG